jgi:hypothetical protein
MTDRGSSDLVETAPARATKPSSERRRRFTRASDPGRFVLTERDAAIAWACFEYQWLTRQHLQRLFGVPGVTRANQRLRQLYDAGVLQRLRVGTVGQGLQPVYLAGEAAVPLLAERSGLPVAAVKERLREDARASAALLPHDLAVNDVRIGLTLGLRSADGAGLETWLNARECYDAYRPDRSLRPDGYFRFVWRDLVHSFFLEVDRGTVSLSRFRAKVERYLEYRDSGAYEARYGLTRFRVLVTAPTEARLAHLLEATREATGRGFWFALTGTAAEEGPHETIWTSVGGGFPRALLESGPGDGGRAEE